MKVKVRYIIGTGGVGGGGGGSVEHNLLDGIVHPDTSATVVQRGMLIVGRLVGDLLKWAGLPLGSSGKFLKSDGSDVVWGNIEASDLPAHNHDAAQITSGRLSLQRMPTSTNANRFLVVRTPNSDPTYDTIQASDLPAHTHSPSQISPQGHGSGLNADMVDGMHASSFEQVSNKGQANGYAPLDSTGKLPTAHLPTHAHSPSDITPQGHTSNLNADMVDGYHASAFAPATHTHAASDITSGRLTLQRMPTSSTANRFLVVRTANSDPTYDSIKASDLPSHTHTKSDITDFAHTHTKSDITDFAHTHTKSDITDFAHTHAPSDITPQGHGSGLNADMLDGVHAENLRIATVGLVIGDGVNAITTGFKGAIWIPFSGTITEWTILSTDSNPPTSGSIEIDVLKSTFTNYPTMTSMVGSGTKPNIANSTKGNGTPSGWSTTAVNAGDCIGFNVTSVTSLKRVTLVLKVVKS